MKRKYNVMFTVYRILVDTGGKRMQNADLGEEINPVRR